MWQEKAAGDRQVKGKDTERDALESQTGRKEGVRVGERGREREREREGEREREPRKESAQDLAKCRHFAGICY